MYYKDNHILQLIAAFLFGFGVGITIGFYLTGDNFSMILIALIIGLASVLSYFSYILFSK